MMQSSFDTVTLQVNTSRNPSRIYVAHEALPVRVAIRNIGTVTALLAYDSSALNGSGAAVGKTYALPAATELIIVMQPKQNLWGLSSGAATQVSFHASVALPVGGLPA